MDMPSGGELLVKFTIVSYASMKGTMYMKLEGGSGSKPFTSHSGSILTARNIGSAGAAAGKSTRAVGSHDGSVSFEVLS